jgi:hypothetical protein
MSRYSQKYKFVMNPRPGRQTEIYQELVHKRNIKKLTQYASPKFPELTLARRQSILYDSHVWSLGDRFYKLAYQYYGDASLWYIIAWFNQSPTENHVNIGDTIMVPVNSERVLTYFNL